MAKRISPATPPSLLIEIVGVLAAASALALGLSFLGFAGSVGGALAAVLFRLIGWMRWIVPVLLLGVACRAWAPQMVRVRPLQMIGSVLVVGGLWILTALAAPHAAGGLSLQTLAAGSGALGRAGMWIVALAAFLIGLTLALTVAVSSLIFRSLLTMFQRASTAFSWIARRLTSRPQSAISRDDGVDAVLPPAALDDGESSAFSRRGLGLGSAQPVALPTRGRVSARARGAFVPSFPIALLDQGDSLPQAGDIAATQSTIRETFENFGIGVDMGEVSTGPTVTQYTLKPATGVKVSQIMALQNDLALSLAAHPIRIEAPIPGRALVGIEVPNRRVARVGLRELLSAEPFLTTIKSNPESLVVTLGKDVAGTPFVGRLDRMPHLLIAGATGSGKTVAINTLITSLLYTKGAEDLKLLLIDPKRVELPAYNGIPHLIAPVITDLKKTITALKWVLREMDRRFTLLAHDGRRDIGSYNSAADEPIPYLVVVIDELADLMVAAASEVESSIIRIAQMARAVGIHLIVATQRPSVDVLTGLIKANMTTRLAFAVASGVDSRTILDATGAEKLLGRGDCLFVSAELSKPKRLQGAFVSEAELQRVVASLCESGAPEYIEVTTPSAGGEDGFSGNSAASDDEDPLLDESIAVIRQAGRASASLLQRRLKIGYARAARILDLLEARGMVGPGEGAKPRDVLIKEPGGDILPAEGLQSAHRGQELEPEAVNEESSEALSDGSGDSDDEQM